MILPRCAPGQQSPTAHTPQEPYPTVGDRTCPPGGVRLRERSPEGCRFAFGTGRQFARSRNSVSRVADQDPGGDGCRGRDICVTGGVICGCAMMKSGTRFARGVNQRIALRSPPRRFRPGFLCLSVLSGHLVNDPVRLAPRDGRFSNSGSAVNAATVRPATLES